MPAFEESFHVSAPRATVWALLDDPARVAACVPGCEDVVPDGPDRFQVRVGVRVGPIVTRQRLRLTVTERMAPTRLAVTGQGEDRGLASRVSLRGAVELRDADDGAATDVSCRVEVQLTGRLAGLGEAVMRAKSAEMVRLFAERLSATIDRPGVARVAGESPPATRV